MNEYLEKVLKELEETREQILESWAGGIFTAETAEGTVQKNAEALGKIQMLEYIYAILKEKQSEYMDD